jgi:mycothiol synthase
VIVTTRPLRPDDAEGVRRLQDVDVVVDPAHTTDLAPRLVDHVVQLCVAQGRSAGAEQVQVDQGCYRSDTAFAEVLRGCGFVVATTFHRMRRELDAPVEVQVPDDVELQRVDDEDEPQLRRAHALHTATFRGHFGFVERPFDEWLAQHLSRAVGTGPLWFARLAGDDVGLLSETDQFLEEDQAGYVQRLGVLPRARGHGVARALLLSSFAHMRERGRRAALLHVDSANATGATRLYEAVGMLPVVVVDAWRLTRSLGERARSR